jgi:hypothetical protein
VRPAVLAFSVLAAIAIAQLVPTSAEAATPAAAAEHDVSEWAGRYCTPTGCAGAPSSPVAQAASFGAAALAIGFLARRRRA